MPTGYTSGIVDGSIKTFEDYAKLCVRAFGATIHMRDEPIDTPYYPPPKLTDSSFHVRMLKDKLNELHSFKDESDAEILREFVHRNENEISRYKEIIEDRKKLKVKMESMLKIVNEFDPPTEQHLDVKKFMIDQIKLTIESDCSISFYEKELERCQKFFDTFDIEIYKKSRIESLKGDIEYHRKKIKEEENRVDNREDWVNDYFKAIETTPDYNKPI